MSTIVDNGILDGQNIFVLASRGGFTYPTARGPMNTEQLWQMPLTSKNMFDLDNTARAINTELKGMTEESFVNTKPNPAAKELAIKLEVVKFIIGTKQAEAEARVAAQARAAEREQLLRLKDVKKAAALESLSEEEIDKRLAQLESGAGQ